MALGRDWPSAFDSYPSSLGPAIGTRGRSSTGPRISSYPTRLRSKWITLPKIMPTSTNSTSRTSMTNGKFSRSISALRKLKSPHTWFVLGVTKAAKDSRLSKLFPRNLVDELIIGVLSGSETASIALFLSGVLKNWYSLSAFQRARLKRYLGTPGLARLLPSMTMSSMTGFAIHSSTKKPRPFSRTIRSISVPSTSSIAKVSTGSSKSTSVRG